MYGVDTISSLFTALVGLEHVYIFLLESFGWGTKKFNITFGIRSAEAEKLKHTQLDVLVKTLFANQGFYNLILAVGLFWGLLHPVPEFGKEIQFFFMVIQRHIKFKTATRKRTLEGR
eukprot:TRINITY_DN4174_c0_g2_i2.p1 TRINITY_DN4174_c0_g2~~TRINITY_DN4174_c0_g2_i2.p1  ORF type:complete len:117 (-),score=19.43 TRINITY_DN4174_c0_g2_i2:208-558(-)